MAADDTGPLYWEDAVPIPAEATPDNAGLAAHFCAQYLAHEKAFSDAILGLPRDPGPEAVASFRASVRANLPVMHTAWTAAAALRGWDAARIWAVTADGDGQTCAEFAWQWLEEGLHPRGSVDVEALVERLTTTVPEPEPVPEAQLALPLDTRRSRRAS